MGLFGLFKGKAKTVRKEARHELDYRNNLYKFNQDILGCISAVYTNENATRCIDIINTELPKAKDELLRYRKLRALWEKNPPINDRETIAKNVNYYNDIERQIAEIVKNATTALKEKYICAEHYNIPEQKKNI